MDAPDFEIRSMWRNAFDSIEALRMDLRERYKIVGEFGQSFQVFLQFVLTYLQRRIAGKEVRMTLRKKFDGPLDLIVVHFRNPVTG
jgi:hypothetical protein